MDEAANIPQGCDPNCQVDHYVPKEKSREGDETRRYKRLFVTGLICFALSLAVVTAGLSWVLPDIKSGFAYNVSEGRVAPSLSVELWEVKRICFDWGLSVDTIYLDLAYNLVPILEIGPFLWYGYNVHTKEWNYGFGIEWVKW